MDEININPLGRLEIYGDGRFEWFKQSREPCVG
jgi:hypothetical protein